MKKIKLFLIVILSIVFGQAFAADLITRDNISKEANFELLHNAERPFFNNKITDPPKQENEDGVVEVIHLSTARNDDGTIMTVGSLDKNWDYIPGDSIRRQAEVKGPRRGWSTPNIEDMVENTWITPSIQHPGMVCDFISKEFEIDEGFKGNLFFRALAFTRHWTYLVKINDDGTETEELITETQYFDWSSKWLGYQNSWNPILENYEIPSGKYYLKIRASSETGVGYTVSMAACAYVNVVEDEIYDMPNSYIYDIDMAKKNNHGGLYIPIDKVEHRWRVNEYLKTQEIPKGETSVSLYWEDVPGLIKSVSLEKGKIKVMINQAKGKGNASIALHRGSNGNHEDPIFWSWHVWVTDDPSYGVAYSPDKQYTLDIEEKPFTPRFMDRNLGATSNTFLGDEWNKTVGLMYQWGRKDPLPPLIHVDFTHYKIQGSFNSTPITYNEYRRDWATTRKYDNIGENIVYSIQNPLKVINASANQQWFSSQSTTTTKKNETVNFDLWGDTNQGRLGSKWEKKNFTYKMKSIFDPCPSGWRVPSFSAEMAEEEIRSPWGGKSGRNYGYEEINPRTGNTKWAGVKIYPGLGFDFSGSNRNLGVYPVSGKMYYHDGSSSQGFQDENAESWLWSATMGYNGRYARAFQLVSQLNPRHNVSTGNGIKFGINTHLATQPSLGLGVRCIQDPNISKMITSKVEYVKAEDRVYTEGLDNPNSYIINAQNGKEQLVIPVSKAYSVYNQYLTDHGWPEGTQLSANVTWATANNLIKTLKIQGTGENASIVVGLNRGITGNAVVSLHIGNKGTTEDKVYWSWHIWSTNGNPEENTITYTTEPVLNRDKSFINYSKTGNPPLTTTFMDRNLGAEEALPKELFDNPDKFDDYKNLILNSGGMHYQWGRKDPFPPLRKVGWAYAGFRYGLYYGKTDANGNVTYPDQNKCNIAYGLNFGCYAYFDGSLNLPYTEEYTNYSNEAGVTGEDKIHEKVSKVLKYSVQNPFTFMYTSNTKMLGNYSGMGDWLSDEFNIGTDRWGHATKKSPFDPCPSGWRVPDQSYVYDNREAANSIIGGSSPWYNGWTTTPEDVVNVLYQIKEYNVVTMYNGVFINLNGGSAGTAVGFNKHPNKMGNYPINMIRGYQTEKATEVAFGSKVRHSGLWTSSMTALGAANAAYIVSTTAEGKFASGRPFSPQVAMDVRCAKDEPRYTGKSLSAVKVAQEKVDLQENQEEGLESKIKVYPNPTSGVFSIQLQDISEGTLQIINMNGIVVLSHPFERNEELNINIQNQPSGIYILRIQKENEVITKKIIKN